MDDNDDEIAFFLFDPIHVTLYCEEIWSVPMKCLVMIECEYIKICKSKEESLCDDDSWYMIKLHASWVLMNISKALQWAGNWLTAHK